MTDSGVAPSARRRYPTVQRREALTACELQYHYLRLNRPVVLGAVAAREWLDRWSPRSLVERFGSSPVEAEETREVYVGERAHRVEPLARLVERSLSGDRTLRWKGLELLRRIPELAAALNDDRPSHRALLPSGAHSFRDTLWIAPRATTSSLHHDGNYDNLNLQISGRKLFLLIPPPAHRALYAYGSAESPVNPFVPDLQRFPAFERTSPLEAWLSPGDVLLIPKYWWHCVYATEAAVNLSTHFSWPGEPAPWDVLRGAPLAHRSLTVLAAEFKRRRWNRLADASRRLWLTAYERLVPRIEPQPRCELSD